MRADAQRNMERILATARDLVVARGPDVPLDDIAAGAGVGIGTLYRRFPNRQALLEAVVLDALVATELAARRALLEEPDAGAALARYLHDALDLGVAAVIPQVLDALDLERGALANARTSSSRAVEALIDAAHASGHLAEDISFADVATMLVRIARPLPGPLTPRLQSELARRHLALFIRSLELVDSSDATSLTGPGMSRTELQKRSTATRAQ